MSHCLCIGKRYGLVRLTLTLLPWDVGRADRQIGRLCGQEAHRILGHSEQPTSVLTTAPLQLPERIIAGCQSTFATLSAACLVAGQPDFRWGASQCDPASGSRTRAAPCSQV
ncbi:hypothetical protein K523DRAFT_324363 [Schizophyllum commune Tattone D]|nr:hypothetical protein K523DRAFT_324363 [Schizophyllum commune Tattone D]